jgi:transcriptional regulator with XRE-family HTH domain
MICEINRKSLNPGDLLAESVLLIHTPAVQRSFRERLGERYLLLRVQQVRWSVAEAARNTSMDRGTITDIEGGSGNPSVGFYERYAEALQTTFEALCREAIADQVRGPLSPEERLILKAYEDGDLDQRETLRVLARTYVTAQALGASTAPPAGPASESPATGLADAPASGAERATRPRRAGGRR